ncbi:MAG: hypothetical protein KAR54_01985 [Candidatus Pacebacteria bacterium]|nr:hypothetical protein [Candidatus Paceibacterota bacterium]
MYRLPLQIDIYGLKQYWLDEFVESIVKRINKIIKIHLTKLHKEDPWVRIYQPIPMKIYGGLGPMVNIFISNLACYPGIKTEDKTNMISLIGSIIADYSDHSQIIIVKVDESFGYTTNDNFYILRGFNSVRK